jgi:hypothetical protein
MLPTIVLIIYFMLKAVVLSFYKYFFFTWLMLVKDNKYTFDQIYIIIKMSKEISWTFLPLDEVFLMLYSNENLNLPGHLILLGNSISCLCWFSQTHLNLNLTLKDRTCLLIGTQFFQYPESRLIFQDEIKNADLGQFTLPYFPTWPHQQVHTYSVNPMKLFNYSCHWNFAKTLLVPCVRLGIQQFHYTQPDRDEH